MAKAPCAQTRLKTFTQGIVELYKGCCVEYAYSTESTLGMLRADGECLESLIKREILGAYRQRACGLAATLEQSLSVGTRPTDSSCLRETP